MRPPVVMKGIDNGKITFRISCQLKFIKIFSWLYEIYLQIHLSGYAVCSAKFELTG